MSDADAWRVAMYVRQARRDSVVDPLFGLRPFLAGINVPDADTAARWYRESLGFTENGATTFNGLRQVVVERGRTRLKCYHRKTPKVHIVRGITALRNSK
jgi:hypothetical protein